MYSQEVEPIRVPELQQLKQLLRTPLVSPIFGSPGPLLELDVSGTGLGEGDVGTSDVCTVRVDVTEKD